MPSQETGHLRATVGANVRHARNAAGVTQRELANRVGVDQMAVSRWERGVVTPTLENLIAVASSLGRPLEWFYESQEAAA